MRIAQQHAHLVDGADDVEAQHELGVGGRPRAAVGGQGGAGRGVRERCEGVFRVDVDGGAVAWLVLGWVLVGCLLDGRKGM